MPQKCDNFNLYFLSITFRQMTWKHFEKLNFKTKNFSTFLAKFSCRNISMVILNLAQVLVNWQIYWAYFGIFGRVCVNDWLLLKEFQLHGVAHRWVSDEGWMLSCKIKKQCHWFIDGFVKHLLTIFRDTKLCQRNNILSTFFFG